MSKSFKFMTRVAAVVAAAALLAGCTPGGNGSGTDPADPSASDEPIRVGLSLGLTGVYSGPSIQYRAAYEYWVDEVNASGGLLGRPVELILYDDESNPTVAQQLYQRLLNEDNVDLLLAPYTTAVGGAVVPLTERAGKVIFNGGFVGKELHATADYLVSGWPFQDVEYSRSLFEFWDTLPESERPKTLAVITAQNPFTLAALEGHNGEDGVLNYAEERGIEVVLNQEYEQTASDLTSLIQRVRSTDADAFLALSLPNDAALIATTVNQVGYNPDWYCQCGSQVVSFPNWPDLGEAAVNVFAGTPAWENQDYNGLEALKEHLYEALDVDMLPANGVAGYSAAQVMQQAVEGAQSLDPQALRDYVANNEFDTVVGKIAYNDDGTIEFRQLLLQYTSDGIVVVWPEEWKTGDAVTPLLQR